MKFCDVAGSPIYRENTLEVMTGDSGNRLAITTSDSPIDLMIALVNKWSPPFFVLYVHIVPRTDHPAGRYQSPPINSSSELSRFLNRFRDLFEADGRHNLWVFASEQNRQIVYDRHEILYIYGDDNHVANCFEKRGFKKNTIEIPVPHAHHYNEKFDATVGDLMNSWDWSYSPLEDSDE